MKAGFLAHSPACAHRSHSARSKRCSVGRGGEGGGGGFGGAQVASDGKRTVCPLMFHSLYADMPPRPSVDVEVMLPSAASIARKLHAASISGEEEGERIGEREKLRSSDKGGRGGEGGDQMICGRRTCRPLEGIEIPVENLRRSGRSGEPFRSAGEEGKRLMM
eukprot:scaffold169079_cov42-Tisochrysis_lutea.AAC.1